MHQSQTVALPTFSPGTSRHITVHRWGVPGARPKVYIQAGLHADELPGIMAACHLIPLLDEAAGNDQIQGEIIVLPAANPIGLSQSLGTYHHGRFAFADGGSNFNRGWPDLGTMILEKVRDKLCTDPEKNTEIMRAALLQAVSALPALAEREAHQKALLSLSIDADYVFDLHCDAQALLHIFANEEHAELAMELGRDMSAPVVMLEKSIDAGLFDECNAGPWIKVRRALNLSTAALPGVCFSPTIELRGLNDVSPQLGENDAANIVNFLRRRGVIAGQAPTLPTALCEATSVDCCDMVKSPCAGMVIWHQPVGAAVTRGSHLADVIDLAAPNPLAARTEVKSMQTGVLFSHRTGYLTRPGEILGQIAGKEPLAHRKEAKFLNP